MRIFIAIDLDDDTKKRLGELQDRMRRLNIGGNYSPRENLHITLAFIGETNDPEAVFDVVEGIKFRPLDITVDRIGSFRGTVFAGVRDTGPLEALALKIRNSLARSGISYDKRKFIPHITLVRDPVFRNGMGIDPDMEPVVTEARSFSVMKSTRGRYHMIYEELCSVPASDTGR
ncbi:MAG: RNA 2',3'-cyclic phosphodiesterase [Christensenellaceae bacterium]|nr:RNA 2',3'-cyclic phosphodiesterase [Christensenellaceae bacterium]